MKTFSINTFIIIILVLLTKEQLASNKIEPTNGIVYVKTEAVGAGDGSSWSNATDNIQLAIDSDLATEVWIAQGTYLPTKLIDSNPDVLGVIDYKLTAFILKDGVNIYGGFKGFEVTIDERTRKDINNDNQIDSWEYSAQTILSGDIGTRSEKIDNSYHVIFQPAKFYSKTIIDGFTIKNGYAFKNPDILIDVLIRDHYNGGGVYLSNNCIIQNSILERNEAQFSGGAVFMHEGNITACLVQDNQSEGNGGGIHGEEVKIKKSSLENNISLSEGGGFYGINCCIEQSKINGNNADAGGGGIHFICNNNVNFCNINQCTVSNNNANLNGGGIYISGGIISNSEINNNRSNDLGGGLSMIGGTCTKTLVHSNHAILGGGGICTSTSSSETIENCRIINNSTQYDGGGVMLYKSSVLINSLITNNKSNGAKGGAGVYLLQGGDVINCTVVNNQQSNYFDAAGGIRVEALEGNVTNSIVWGNYPQGGFLNGQVSAYSNLVNYCAILEDSYMPEGICNINLNQNNNPQFKNAHSLVGLAKTEEELQTILNADWSLEENSACIGKANYEDAPDEDINGKKRDELPDIGAFEFVINTPPIASAGNNQSIKEGEIVTLNGSSSYDPDGDELIFHWTSPIGIELSSNNVSNPTFVAPEVEQDTTYIFYLVVNDGTIESTAEQVGITIKHVNKPPVANAGNEQIKNEGELVTLDGSGSYDPDGDELIFQWTAPTGIELNSQNIVNPTFIAPEVKQDTTYTFSLIVNDNTTDSPVQQVKIIIKQINKTPVANAGNNQNVDEGELVTLNGSSSYDPDEDKLTFVWTSPIGIELSSNNLSNPTFIAPEVKQDTTYIFDLIVNDGIINSPKEQVQITIRQINQSPIADAGNNQIINEGDSIILDGSNSYDPDGDKLIYKWFKSDGSEIIITESSKTYMIAPEVYNDSILHIILITNDGELNSEMSSVQIEIRNIFNTSASNFNNPNETIRIYPNPIERNNEFTIELNDNGNRLSSYNFMICNINGQTVLSKQIKKSKISIDGLSKGIYFIYVESCKNQHFIKKLVVQ